MTIEEKAYDLNKLALTGFHWQRAKDFLDEFEKKYIGNFRGTKSKSGSR